MRRYTVLRTHFSPYQNAQFSEIERNLLETLPGISYGGSGENLILITNTHTVLRNLDADLIKRTKLIVHPNSGYDNFAKDAALWKDIPLIVGHSIRAAAVAEWTIGCLFEGLLEIPQHLTWNKDRKWERQLLRGTNVAIFGHGHIGKMVTDTCRILGMEVTVVDPFQAGHVRTWRALDLKRYSVVISCMSLNSTSRKLFNADFFANTCPELLFINGARGGLVDEVALREFLLSHPHAKAFLDVFEHEPFGPEWHSFPNVWKTSHIAGVHAHLDQSILDFEHQVIQNFVSLSDSDFKLHYKDELLQNKIKNAEFI